MKPTMLMTVPMLVLVACVTPEKRTAIGAGAGAATGAVVGAALGGWKGAAAGAVAGGAVGAAAGNMLDREAAELKQKDATTKRTAEGILVRLKEDLLFNVDSDVLKTGAVEKLASLGDILAKYPNNKFSPNDDKQTKTRNRKRVLFESVCDRVCVFGSGTLAPERMFS